MPTDTIKRDHEEWLGYVQPVGLVVSIPALIEAQAIINRNFGPEHRSFLQALPIDRNGDPIPEIRDFPAFAQKVFEWTLEDLHGSPGGPTLPDALEVPLPDYNETLRPTYALREYQPPVNGCEWILLVQTVSGDFDEVGDIDSHRWQASPQARIERLLRETEVPIGLLVNRHAIRLVYAPRGESSGHITFRLPEMVQVAGRPIFGALHMLLCAERLYSLGENERLPAILKNSRLYQNEVSTRLAGQVMAALFELLRGFQSAHGQSNGQLLQDVLAKAPNQVYAGLVTTLMRLVFVLFAEDKGLLSADPVYVNYYSVGGLFERLREDDAQHHDTMDQRYGAWAQLLTLFRLLYNGGSHGGLDVPARRGYLFDPDSYPFLEGRLLGSKADDESGPLPIPRVSDGVLFKVLRNLLVLDGERISYRNLDVEQIGSVYEAIMGFELEVAQGRSIAMKAKKAHGAPATINLEALLAAKPADRPKWLSNTADQTLSGQALTALKSAETIDDLLAALDRRIARHVTPNPVTKGSMIFQPSGERRRSGSHYTPRSLTQPIVEAALGPVLKTLGPKPRPERILELEVCDPAMGSGAFLVEACRQLGEALLESWRVHDCLPVIPSDEDELLYARRVVAQRCLYGLDKNEMAADLAKLSLWLATLAKDHPFTFLDHALRHGDSLVGLSAEQVEALNWQPPKEGKLLEGLPLRLGHILNARKQILDAAEDTPYDTLAQKLAKVEEQMADLRLAGDLAVAAFFEGNSHKSREKRRKELAEKFELARERVTDLELEDELQRTVRGLRSGPKGIPSFHWELEFPEVFQPDSRGKRAGGFHAIVGNPPFAGKNTLIEAHADGYLDWLKTVHDESHGNADLAAHFYRRAFKLLRPAGCFGLIATNTIAQGDTRSTGLRWICTHGGTIYRARKRHKWPGEAAVVVSVVHICKGKMEVPFLLDNREVPIITAYLFHAGGHEDPAPLKANEDKSFQGSIVLGMGFTFDDTDKKGVATPISEMHRLIEEDPRNQERILPYVGGEEVNNSPTHDHHRYAISFADWPLQREDKGKSWRDATDKERREWLRTGVVPLDYPEAVATDYPSLLALVEHKVRPLRLKDNRESYRRYWWQYAEKRVDLYESIRDLPQVLAINCGATPHMSFCFLDSRTIFANTLVVVAFHSPSAFCVLQARVHEVWVRFFASSLEDRLRYTPTDCFQTFPLPRRFDENEELERAGHAYNEHRASIMQQNSEGLTKTYNRFHDPGECSSDFVRLRELHDQMDRAVLDSYEWSDIKLACEFIPLFNEDHADEDTRRQQKYRYRWPDEIHDEVLARLLALNQERDQQEALLKETGVPRVQNTPKRKRAQTRRPVATSAQSLLDLLGEIKE